MSFLQYSQCIELFIFTFYFQVVNFLLMNAIFTIFLRIFSVLLKSFNSFTWYIVFSLLSFVLLIHSCGFPSILGDIWLYTHFKMEIPLLSCCMYFTTCFFEKQDGMLDLGDISAFLH